MNDYKNGFTLIEVMVALVLVLVAIIGLNAAFSSVSAVTRDLTLRQKAIFALDNEMERLYGIYSLYKRNVLALSAITDQSDFLTLCDLGRDNPYEKEITDYEVLTTAPTLDTDNYLTSFDGVYLYDDGSGGAIDKNIVPIDFEKRITGELTWTCSSTPGDYYNITLTMTYPFRFNSSSDPVNTSDSVLVKDAETIDLQTSFRK